MIGQFGLASYVASKWGVRGLTKTAALELAHRQDPRQLHPPRCDPHPDGGRAQTRAALAAAAVRGLAIPRTRPSLSEITRLGAVRRAPTRPASRLALSSSPTAATCSARCARAPDAIRAAGGACFQAAAVAQGRSRASDRRYRPVGVVSHPSRADLARRTPSVDTRRTCHGSSPEPHPDPRAAPTGGPSATLARERDDRRGADTGRRRERTPPARTDTIGARPELAPARRERVAKATGGVHRQRLVGGQCSPDDGALRCPVCRSEDFGFRRVRYEGREAIEGFFRFVRELYPDMDLENITRHDRHA